MAFIYQNKGQVSIKLKKYPFIHLLLRAPHFGENGRPFNTFFLNGIFPVLYIYIYVCVCV